MPISKKDIPSWIKKYIGKEFKEVGREENFDCWGLIRYIYKEKFNIELPRYDEYDSVKELEKLSALITEGKECHEWFEIENSNEKFADLVLFKIRGQLCHVGFCLGKGLMLHIQSGKNSCIEDYLGLKWARRIDSFYRHEKLFYDRDKFIGKL